MNGFESYARQRGGLGLREKRYKDDTSVFGAWNWVVVVPLMGQETLENN